MALISCTKSGPDEIQSHLGGGGVGEVCKSARDTRLDRIVAIKALHILNPQNACPQDWPRDMDYNPRHARCFFLGAPDPCKILADPPRGAGNSGCSATRLVCR